MKQLLVLLLLSSFHFVQASQFEVDKAHSAIEFKVRHLLTKTSGMFKDFQGEFVFDEKKPEAATGKMTIKVESINTNDAKRDDHLRSPDFFDSSKYETITFESKNFKKTGNGKYKLSGDMTMRGITKPITFDVNYLGMIEKDPFGKKRVSFEAKAKINRKDFGMVWNKTTDETLADKAKKVAAKTVVGDDVELNLTIEAVAK